MNLNQVIGSAKKFTHENSPHILTALGVVGTLTTAYLAAKASYQASYVVACEEEALDRTQDPLTLPEKVKLVWPLYTPAVASGAATVTSIIFANRVSAKRSAAYAAAYSVLEASFTEYQKKVVEQIGARQDRALKDGMAQDKVDANPPDKSQIIVSSGNVLCCELYTGRYFMSDMETLRRAQNDINSKIINELYTTVGEFYDSVGLPRTTHSDDLGWNSDKLMELVFTTVLSEDNRPCIAFDYNYIKPI